MFDFCVSPSIKPVKFGTLNPGDTFTVAPISSTTRHTFILMKISATAFINNVVTLNNGCCLVLKDEEKVFPVQVENIVTIGE